MAAINGLDIGEKVCDILGLDSHMVRSIVIEIFPDDIVYVKVGRIITEEELDKVMELVKTYKLVSSDMTDEIKQVK